MTFQTGQVIGFDPTAQSEQAPGQNEFAALVKVISSRYAPTTYTPESGYTNKIAIKWIMLTTTGKQFDRTYSTGIPLDGAVDISPDGKRLIARGEMGGFKPNSDAVFLFRTAITAGFPQERVNGDASVFENECFFIVNQPNPGWTSAAKKPYPKEYHPEGFEAALAARAAKKAAQTTYAPPTTQQVSSYQVPQVVAGPDPVVLTEASNALTEILITAGAPVTRSQMPSKINELASKKTWTPKLRQDITLALWDPNQLNNVVASNPALQISGETISLK